MKVFAQLHRKLLILFACTVGALVAHGFFSMDSMLAEQSRAQQKSLSPAVNLITEHLTRPLHISQAIAKSDDLVRTMQDSDALVEYKAKYLQKLESQFNMSFFMASEASRIQTNADGSSIDLIEGEVNWYFKYKEAPSVVSADIGKWEDVHFYIDVKVFNEKQEFIGFVGVAKQLKSFLATFETFRTNYGFEFVFVNARGQVMLASDPNLNPQKNTFKQVDSLGWYQKAVGPLNFDDSDKPAAINNKMVMVDNVELLISQFSVNNFDWELYLVAPTQFQASPLNISYLIMSVLILIVISVLFLMMHNDISKIADSNKPDVLKLSTGFLCSDEMIKSIIQFNTYKKPSHLVMLRVNHQHSEFNTVEQVRSQYNIACAVSNKLVATIPTTNKLNLIGKTHQNQWLLLFQQTDYAQINRHIKNIKHALDTLQINAEQKPLTLDYVLVETELDGDKDIASILFELERELQQA